MNRCSRREGGATRRILYIEMAAGAGGSVTGLHRLLQGLDRDRVEPVVMLHAAQPLLPRFRELGLDIVTLPGSVPAKASTPDLAKSGVEALAGTTPDRVLGVVRLRRTAGTRVPVKSQTTVAPKSGLYRSARFYLWFVRRRLAVAWSIRKVIADRRIDAVHLNDDIAFNREALLGAALARVPCLAHIRFFYETRAIDWPLSGSISHYIYMSRALEDYTLARFPAAPGTIVYDGLTEDYFQPLPDAGAMRRELGLESDDFVVASLGRLLEWKGHKVLLRALAGVIGKVPNLKCLIVGEPDPPTETAYLEELKAMVADLGLAGAVRFAGFRSDVRGVLSAVDVLVHSSSEPEPFGLVIIEGMAAGKPVIATAAGGVLDIVDDGATGLLVPVADSQAMANALSRLADLGPAGRKQLGDAARRSARERFTVESYAQGVQRIYDRVLDSQALRRGGRQKWPEDLKA